MSSGTHYDIIVIGSGPGGAFARLQKLAPTGKKILMLERGDYLPRSQKNWDSKTVFVDGTYQVTDTWYGKRRRARSSRACTGFVGGNSKVYGAALVPPPREGLRRGPAPCRWAVAGMANWVRRPSSPITDRGGKAVPCPRPAWRGSVGAMVVRRPMPIRPCRMNRASRQLSNTVGSARACNPFHLPLGILLEEKDGQAHAFQPLYPLRCVRWLSLRDQRQGRFAGHLRRPHAEAARQFHAADQRLRLHASSTDPSGRSVSTVHVVREGNIDETYSADIVVVACGALSSALLLLLRSAGRQTSEWPRQQLGPGGSQLHAPQHERILMALLKEPNHTVFQKTLGAERLLLRIARARIYPLGLIQMCATSHGDADSRRGAARPSSRSLPNMPFDKMAEHSMDFWLQTEDLPNPHNRIAYDGDRVVAVPDGKQRDRGARR